MMSLKLYNQSLSSNTSIFNGSRCFSTTSHNAVDNNLNIDNIMTHFMNFNHQPDVMEISTIMEDLNNLTLSLSEFENYQPFIEEVADVAKE